LTRFDRTVLLALAYAGVVLGAPSCGVGTVGGPPLGPTGNGAGMGGAAPVTGAAGSASSTGAAGAGAGSSGSGTSGTKGSDTGASGAGGAAGSSSMGAAGTSSTGAAGTSSTGAAGTSSVGAAGSSSTGAAGRAGSSGAAGAAGSGAAGSGAAGAGPVAMPHCKRGEAYQSNSLADLKALSKGITWWYNWTTSPDKGVATTFQTTGVEFVPMIWGGNPDPATIEKQIPKSAKYVLGFNEPNFGAQSHIPAAQAAALWPKVEQIAHDMNLKIGSPAPNYCAGDCNDTDPIHYLDTFFAACTGCQVDFIAAHWYACTGDALKNYLSKLKKYGKPIWVTEFSCMDDGDHSAAGEQTYMKTALDILENDPTIFRYSWFTGRFPDPSGINLLGGDGQLTDLGNLYVTSPATGVCGP
jgi:hypothetical protein